MIIWEFNILLPSQECDYLRSVAMPRLHVSTVVDAKTGKVCTLCKWFSDIQHLLRFFFWWVQIFSTPCCAHLLLKCACELPLVLNSKLVLPIQVLLVIVQVTATALNFASRRALSNATSPFSSSDSSTHILHLTWRNHIQNSLEVTEGCFLYINLIPTRT